MTIEKRSEWGTVVVRTDVARRFHDYLLLDNASCPQAGDMYLSLGSPNNTNNEQTVWRQLPVDHIAVRLDDGEWLIGQAHVTAGKFLFGEFCIAANTAFVRAKHIFHSSHPNDGIIEFLVVDSHMPIRQRLLALRKVAHGTHLPHPFIANSRGKHKVFQFNVPTRIRIDGRRVGRCTTLEVRVSPDAGAVFIPSTEATQET